MARPFAVDVASGVEAEPGVKDHALLAAFFERGPHGLERGATAPHERSRAALRAYGGRYVPETLIAALDELTRGLGGGARATRASGRARRACTATSSAGRRRSTWPRGSPSGSGGPST